MKKSELLNSLFEKYNLVFDLNDPNSKDNDVYIHKHYKIITRGGIQKIERASGIKCDIVLVSSGRDYANVSGTGKTKDNIEYSTLASANADNCQNAYYCEMAEKRCRSRLILTLAGLYETGEVFGEDEADDFSRGGVKTASYKGGNSRN